MSLIIFGYEIDVELAADPLFPNEVTPHPVEAGSDVTDHVRVLPIRLAIEGVVSNAPFGTLKARREELVVIDGETFAKPDQEADAFLRSIRNSREPGTVECSRGIFENMVMVSYTPRSSTHDVLMFTAEFEQIEIVNNDRIRVEVRRKQKRGHKPSISIEAPDAPPAPNATTQNAVASMPARLKQ